MIVGTTAPTPTIILVAADETTEYVGRFAPHGFLRVTTSPALPATIYVDGIARNAWGMWQSMPPGTYKISFEPLDGFVTPVSQVLAVNAGQLAEVEGRYTPVALLAGEPNQLAGGTRTALAPSPRSVHVLGPRITTSSPRVTVAGPRVVAGSTAAALLTWDDSVRRAVGRLRPLVTGGP